MTNPPRLTPYSAAWWVQASGYSWLPDAWPTETTLVTNTELLTSTQDGTDVFCFEPSTLKEPMGNPSGWLVLNEDGEGGFEPNGWCYDPLSVPGLHRRFSSLPIESGAIGKFACEYGLLGRCVQQLFEHDKDKRQLRWGESATMWVREILAMRDMIDVWDAVSGRAKSPETQVHEILRFTGSSTVELVGGNWDKLGLAHLLPERVTEFVFCEPSRVQAGPPWKHMARRWLEVVVTRSLREGAHPVVVSGRRVPILIRPRDLLGALHIQLAEELTGQAGAMIKCQACDKYFYPVHGRQVYCDDRCKLKAYRQRKKVKAQHG